MCHRRFETRRPSLLVPASILFVALVCRVQADPNAKGSSKDSALPSGAKVGTKEQQLPTMRTPNLEGYDPVSYFLSKGPMKGDPTIQSDYCGETYYFAKESNKKMFDADPDRFAPQYGGLCTAALGNMHNRFTGDPRAYAVADGKLYLFSSTRALQFYETRPEAMRNAADRLFKDAMFDSTCPVTLITQKKAIKGESTYGAVAYQRPFHFATKEAKALFVKDPDRYLPSFMGHCPVTWLDNGSRRIGNADHFSIVDGQAYLFDSAAAKAAFDARPQHYIDGTRPLWNRFKPGFLKAPRTSYRDN